MKCKQSKDQNSVTSNAVTYKEFGVSDSRARAVYNPDWGSHASLRKL